MTTRQDDTDSVLAPLREELDELDQKILECLARRMQTCLHIAELKSRHGIAMMQPHRVGLVIRRAEAFASENGLSPEYLAEIFRRVIDETCTQEDELMSRFSTGENA